MATIPEALGLAMQYHQSGQLQQAEPIYRQILQVDPNHVDALHLLGVLAGQLGNRDRAIQYISQAIRIRPAEPAFHFNLAKTFHDQRKLPEAVAEYRHVIRLKPDHVEAHLGLGHTLQAQGQLVKAVAEYQEALRLKPDVGRIANPSYYAEAHNSLGNALQALGRLAEAVAEYQEALRLKLDYAEAHNNLGNALSDQGQLAAAVAHYQEAFRLKPDYAEAHNNLGIALKDQGRLAEAVAEYHEAIRLKPDYAEAYNNLGIAHQDQGQLADAVVQYQEAIRLKPDYAEAHNSLGNALQAQGQLAAAVAQFQQALRLKPDYAAAHSNLGNILKEQGHLTEAVAHYQEAIRLKPDFPEVHNNLGIALKDQGRLVEALAHHQEAIRLRPDFVWAHSNLVYILPFHPGYDAEAIYEENRRWHQQHAEPLKKFIQPHSNHPDPERKLRVGYVSPDFRDHCQSFFTMPLLSNHDHRQFEIFCYAKVVRPDALTQRLRGYADEWRSTVGLSDQQLADLVRSDRIDILVDLTMHMAGSRLLVFARKPAPVQVTWLAYPGTTGLSTIDYRLTDPYLDPPELGDDFYAEESLRLPDTFWCYDPHPVVAWSPDRATTLEPLVTVLSATQTGCVTFGCLNNFCKINDGVLTLWARVLRAVPHSHLLLLAPRGNARDDVLAKFQQEGIAAPRVEFADKQSRLDYLKLYNRIDLGLDPLPYNGHTTSLDAFWMGVPTITLVGKTAFGRAGWSQLCNLGLKELAATTPEQYVEIAAELAGDLPRLQELRANLRQWMVRSPLMDAKRFACNMEQAFRQMWRRWCREAKFR